MDIIDTVTKRNKGTEIHEGILVLGERSSVSY